MSVKFIIIIENWCSLKMKGLTFIWKNSFIHTWSWLLEISDFLFVKYVKQY